MIWPLLLSSLRVEMKFNHSLEKSRGGKIRKTMETITFQKKAKLRLTIRKSEKGNLEGERGGDGEGSLGGGV